MKTWIFRLETKMADSCRDSVMTMLASEEVLKKDWDNKLDERWNYL